MKIYKLEPKLLIRVQITKIGEITEYLTLCETNLNDAIDFIEKTLERKTVSPFLKGNKTRINIREYLNGKNGKAKNLSCRGFSPYQIKDFLKRDLELVELLEDNAKGG